jgi:hypothetical protein
LSALIAESVRKQNDYPANMSIIKSNVMIEQTSEKNPAEIQSNSKTSGNSDLLEQWNRPNIPPYSYS